MKARRRLCLYLTIRQKRAFFALPWYWAVIHFYIQNGIFEFTNAFIIIFSLTLCTLCTFLVSSPIDKLSGRLRKLQLIRNTPKCDFCCFSIAWWLNMDGLQFINGVLLVLLISALLAKGKLIINILSASNRIKGDLSLSRPLTAIRTSQRKKEKNTLKRLFIKEYIRGIMELLSFRLIYHNAIMLNIEYL